MPNKDCLCWLQCTSINQLQVAKHTLDFFNRQANQIINDWQNIAQSCPSSTNPLDTYGYLLGISVPISFQIAMSIRDYFYLCSHELIDNLNSVDAKHT